MVLCCELRIWLELIIVDCNGICLEGDGEGAGQSPHFRVKDEIAQIFSVSSELAQMR